MKNIKTESFLRHFTWASAIFKSKTNRKATDKIQKIVSKTKKNKSRGEILKWNRNLMTKIELCKWSNNGPSSYGSLFKGRLKANKSASLPIHSLVSCDRRRERKKVENTFKFGIRLGVRKLFFYCVVVVMRLQWSRFRGEKWGIRKIRHWRSSQSGQGHKFKFRTQCKVNFKPRCVKNKTKKSFRKFKNAPQSNVTAAITTRK